VAHPHSLAGGTMAQPVVYRVARGCRERGLATLRFNFRGVGRSGGTFSGREEYRDVEAAAAFLRGRLASVIGKGLSGSEAPPLALAGYSFGSVMVARAAAGAVPVQALALVGFVVSWPELPPDTLDRLGRFRGPVLAVCAENDELGLPEDVDRALGRLGLDYSLSVVKDAGHFLEGRHREVGELVAEFLSSRLRLDRFGGE
jgi:alpha/beta superfamily hydrolase